MLKIELQISRANLTSRAHARLMREINRATAESHYRKRIPQHFTEKAYTLYRARKRGEKYNRWKQNKFGHKRPNVRTGTLLRNLASKITATQYGAKLVMRSRLRKSIPQDQFDKMSPAQKAKASAKVNRRLARWQKNEIAIVSRGEITEDRKNMARAYKHGAQKPEYKRKRQRRIK